MASAQLDYKVLSIDSDDDGLEPEYLDLGSLRIPFLDQMNIELDLDSDTGQVVSVSLSLGNSVVSIQAFSSPSDEQAWPSVRDAIVSELSNQHVETKVEIGNFGTEIRCFMPTLDEHGTQIVQNIRFVGVDGPRWFLRCTVGGDAATPSQESRIIDDLISKIQVDRGDSPMPPGELLPLAIPDSD